MKGGWLLGGLFLVGGAIGWIAFRGLPWSSTQGTEHPLVETALRFDDAAEAWGLRFRHHADLSPAKHMPETMGSGVAVCDLNRDGAPDVLFVDSGQLAAARTVPEAGHRLYLNDGQGRFRDVTRDWNLEPGGYGFGVAAGDVDGDGWTDVLLTSFGAGLRLLRNTGAASRTSASAPACARSR